MTNEVKKTLLSLSELAENNLNKKNIRECIFFLDVTTLDVKDTHKKVESFTKGVMEKIEKNDLSSVASICVLPRFIENVGLALGNSPIAITSVVGSFPLAQTYIEVKILECAMALENGADELDIVLDVGAVIEGNDDLVLSELSLIKEEIGDDALLKVIIECGELKTEQNIARATQLAIDAGADFVKTSTGKVPVNATFDAVALMCEVIKEHYIKTSSMVGIKVAGGVSSIEELIQYYTLVKEILGEKWLTSQYFRIGTSSLFDKMIDFLKK